MERRVGAVQWRVVTYRIAADASRHRVAVWRELRRAGAVPVHSATWAVPGGNGFDDTAGRAAALVERAGGQAFVFDVMPSEAAGRRLEELFTAGRQAEWDGFATGCGKALAELAGWTKTARFTLAQLDEEETSHERLRRWFRELRARDLFGAPGGEAAKLRLAECAAALEEYAGRVYQARQLP
jgi:hypothetical protein